MPCCTYARTTEAVPSGLRERLLPALSSKVYISLSTMSVDSPMLRVNTSVCSMTGGRNSSNPYARNTSEADFSICCQM